MNRLINKIKTLRDGGKKALSMFITAGYPSLNATVEIVKSLESSGTDFIELGIPFSDPLADGPVIQQSSDTAIKNGVTIPVVFDIVAAIRSISDIPIVLMGYVNPVLSYGIGRFMETAALKGADGVIVPDIPVEESEEYRISALENYLSPIFLTSPTTDDIRIRQIDDLSEAFVYCVSVTGVTGRNTGLPPETEDYLKRCRKLLVKNPMMVGFGVSSAEDVKTISRYADGVIVGSALIKLIGKKNENDYFTSIGEFVRELRRGLA